MENLTHLPYPDRIRVLRPFGWEIIEEKHAPFHFQFEELDPFYWNILIEKYWAFAYYVCVAYILTIFGLRRWMKDRPAYDVKGALFYWNLSLGVFAAVGFARTIPGFLHMLGSENGFYTSICLKKEGDIPFTFWVLLFIFSKFVELGDSVFVLLMKKELKFVQWYHHMVTMSVTWVVAPHMEPVARWYTVMNYGEHALMYIYFAVKAKGLKMPKWIANFIISTQLTQMVVGLVVNMLSAYYTHMGSGCARYPASMRAFNVVYGSFIILFGKLFYDEMTKRGKRKVVEEQKKID